LSGIKGFFAQTGINIGSGAGIENVFDASRIGPASEVGVAKTEYIRKNDRANIS
jgi:hypothetical protein